MIDLESVRESAIKVLKAKGGNIWWTDEELADWIVEDLKEKDGEAR